MVIGQIQQLLDVTTMLYLLIIVIVFIGIFASVALTRTQLGLSVIQEQIAIDQITNDIDLARSMALPPPIAPKPSFLFF